MPDKIIYADDGSIDYIVRGREGVLRISIWQASLLINELVKIGFISFNTPGEAKAWEAVYGQEVDGKGLPQTVYSNLLYLIYNHLYDKLTIELKKLKIIQ